MPGENLQDWSITAANNSNSDSSINWAEGQTRSSVNNSSRAMMAAHAKDRNLHNGSIVTGGTANAQTFFSGLNYTTAPTGLLVKLKVGPDLTNTGPCTLSMDNIGAVAIKDQFGNALIGGELIAGSYIDMIYDGTNWVLLTALGGSISTGDVKLTFKTTADVGWVMMNDGSIGNAASGATRANADTQALFALLYSNITALIVQDSAGATVARGVDAATDYAANRRLVLPSVLGRALAVAGAGSGLTARVLGSAVGEENHTLTTAELAAHAHGVSDPTHTHGVGGLGSIFTSTGAVAGNYLYSGGNLGFYDSSIAGINAAYTGISIQNAGSGGAHNTMQPTTFLNVMIKL